MKPTPRYPIRSIVFVLLTLGGALPAWSDEKPKSPEFSAEQIEFFEKKIRPLLVNNCYKCHGPDKEEPDGGLRLHSRAWILEGGDSGPAIEPGNPDESLLLLSVRYEAYEMPPRNQLPEDQIALLAKWIEQGAPWPADEAGEVVEKQAFPLWERKEAHWAWHPVMNPEPPAVKDTGWAHDPIDRFILAKLEGAGLAPAPPADRRTLIRRAYFDVIGLPPTPEQIDTFLNDPAPTQQAFRTVVDELLASPHFGERWARHWLDSVRFASTRGHEYDPLAPNAYQYRNYVIRALNADVPYDRFVIEHLAGDLVENPRLHPEQGFNESVLGTGFWFLNEQVHSPVDIRADEVDRFDNSIDVATKTFLGLTVSCARCHDHKFDAISTKDYYALHGYLQSSRYVQAPFESMVPNRKIAEQLAERRDAAQRELMSIAGEAVEKGSGPIANYLMAAREALMESPREPAREDRLLADFESGDYRGWSVSGDAFGDAPHTLETIAPYQGRINGVGKFFVNSHNIRNGGRDSVAGDAGTGEMLSDEFPIDRHWLAMLVGGGAHEGKTCVNLLIGDKIVRTATGRNDNQMFEVVWDLRDVQGKMARLQVIDAVAGDWGNIGLDQVVLTDRSKGSPRTAPRLAQPDAARIAEIARQHRLDAKRLEQWTAAIRTAAAEPSNPLHLWASVSLDPRAGDEAFVAQRLAEVAAQTKPAAGDDAKTHVITDFTRPLAGNYLQEGFSFHLRPRLPGDIEWGASSETPIARLHTRGGAWRDRVFADFSAASGNESDPGDLNYLRAGRTLHTATFELDERPLWIVARGKAKLLVVVDSHRVIDGPLHRELAREFDTGGKVQAIAVKLPAYVGHEAHLEITPVDDQPFAVFRVQQSATAPPVDQADARRLLVERSQPKEQATLQTLADDYRQTIVETARLLKAGGLADSPRAKEHAVWADWIISQFPMLADDGTAAKFNQLARESLVEQQRLAAGIVRRSRTALAIMDGSGENERVMIRGGYQNPGEIAPRQLLVAIAGENQPAPESGSGRLALAKRIVDRSNPFASRVIVNRIWYHLTGQGIVASVDNLGLMGDPPTHPQLLDHLATRIVDEGWSRKRMIRGIMLSSTYQMSSRPGGRAEQIDPTNQLLHRMRIRRLQGEVIRDAMLSISGRLDPKLEGPPVEIYLTEFMTGRGRPDVGGPLDGAGRRSIYIRVRRNFLSPMMIAFDTPIPFNAMGKRNVSNVPAQALILMNDPFVVGQAEQWAKRILKAPDATPHDRITAIYRQGLGRPPSDEELQATERFLQEQAALRGLKPDEWRSHLTVWSDLCHVVFNMKEFIYIN